MAKKRTTPYIAWRNKGFSYFCNTQCEYSPYHNADEKAFNCLFCYCPLYDDQDCGGTFVYLEDGTKDFEAGLVGAIKAQLGPWPRALEVAGLKGIGRTYSAKKLRRQEKKKSSK